MAVFGDRIQTLMDEVYNEWQKEENRNKGKWGILKDFSEAHQIAVVFGNFNHQVENGGIEQWIYNGYFHEDAEKLSELLEVGAKFDERCQTILNRIYTLDQYAQETECDRYGSFHDEDGESGFIGDSINCNAFDTWYYEHCGKDDWWKTVCEIIDKAETLETTPTHHDEGKDERAAAPSPIQVYIENANNASIGGFTIPLPTTREALATWFAAVEADSNDPGSIKIVETRSPITDLGRALRGTDATLDELNYLAAKINNLSKHDLNMFLAGLEVERYGGGVMQIINLIENIRHFELQPAFSEAQYGEFLMEMEKDNSMEVFDRLNASEDSEERVFAEYVLRLEAHVDVKAYALATVKQENGIFTEHGYLADRGEFVEVYHGPQDIPAKYRIFLPTDTSSRDLMQEDCPLELNDCIPGGMETNLKGKVVAIRAEELLPEYRALSHQLMLATGGFGCAPEARGRAVFGTNLYLGEQERWNRSDIEGVVAENTLPAWAQEKLTALRVPAEKESVMDKIREAKAAAKKEPPAEQKPKTHDKSGPEL